MSDFLILHHQDNVAIALNKLVHKTDITIDGTTVGIQEDVPVMHKVAIRTIEKGQKILKYGQPIGIAGTDIKAGQHVHAHNIDAATSDKDYGFCRNAKPTDFIAEAERATFLGYRRSNGKFGTRNYLGIITTVNCSATVASNIAGRFSYPGALDAYPNVDGVVALTHEGGCGMRTEGEGYELLQRTLEGYAKHPNFGGILVIGLGCESMQISRFLKDSHLQESALFKSYNIQDVGGTKSAIQKGVEQAEGMLPQLNLETRTEAPASELVVAMQCGGSDAFSGITANPALGAAGDLLVRNGGTVIYSETPEIFGAEHLLTQRSKTPEIAEQLLERIRWWEDYTHTHGFEMNNNPSPGNKAGGLSTIMEKSLGAQAKSGSTEMVGVYKYAEPIDVKGLVFMDSPGFDPVSVTGQIASGANIVCFTTGRGSAFGCKPVPSIKLASNSALFERQRDDIDINCGEIIDGQSVQACGESIFEAILKIASGEQTKSEDLGYGHNEFNPWKIGAVV